MKLASVKATIIFPVPENEDLTNTVKLLESMGLEVVRDFMEGNHWTLIIKEENESN